MFDFILNHLAGILQTLLLSLRVARGQGVVVPDSVVVGRRTLYEARLCLDSTFMWVRGTCLSVELNKQHTQLYCGAVGEAKVETILLALPTKRVPRGLITRKGGSTQQKMPWPATLEAWRVAAVAQRGLLLAAGPGLGCATRLLDPAQPQPGEGQFSFHL